MATTVPKRAVSRLDGIHARVTASDAALVALCRLDALFSPRDVAGESPMGGADRLFLR
jgi:hypothetical protein